jgi:hypothetical protein
MAIRRILLKELILKPCTRSWQMYWSNASSKFAAFKQKLGGFHLGFYPEGRVMRISALVHKDWMIGRRFLLIVVTNAQLYGSSWRLAPQAQLDDGLLDVTLLRKLRRLRLLRLFPTVYSGRHVEFEEVSTIQARSIRILAPAGYPMAPDGEFHGKTPAEITCLPRDLDLFCP